MKKTLFLNKETIKDHRWNEWEREVLTYLTLHLREKEHTYIIIDEAHIMPEEFKHLFDKSEQH